MDQRVSLRRFIVPALLAGLTLCGTLGWSPSASAREPAARVVVAPTHASGTRASHPMLSTVPVRSTVSRSVSSTTIPTKTVALHFTPAPKLATTNLWFGR